MRSVRLLALAVVMGCFESSAKDAPDGSPPVAGASAGDSAGSGGGAGAAGAPVGGSAGATTTGGAGGTTMATGGGGGLMMTGGTGGSTGGAGGVMMTGGTGGSTGGAGGVMMTGGTGGSTGGAGGVMMTGGTGGTGGSGGGPLPECDTPDDCQLVDDCCTCAAIPDNRMKPYCDPAIQCFVNACAPITIGAAQVQCIAGRCVLDVECAGEVLCDVLEPDCREGTVPQVKDGCYTGACVPVQECIATRSCDDCTATQACVVYDTQLGFMPHCIEVPDECRGDETCDCMGAGVCIAPFGTCGEVQSDIHCACILC